MIKIKLFINEKAPLIEKGFFGGLVIEYLELL